MCRTLHPKPYALHPHSSRSSRRGQSLVEAVVAISVLTTGFLGISSLLARSLFLTRVVADQITANYLAEEGIEIAKNLIDHDVFARLATPPQGFGWGACFDPGLRGTNDFELDYTTTDCNALIGFSGSSMLLFDPVTKLYGYHFPASDNPVTTGFTREIRVNENGDKITVNSIVRWSTATVTGQSLNLEDHFYNWR